MPWRAAVVVTLCFVGGFALAQSTLEADRVGQELAEPATDTPAEAPSSPPSAPQPMDTPEPAALPAGPAEPTGPPPEPEVQPIHPTFEGVSPRHGTLAVTTQGRPARRGRVAYLRCDGLPARPGPYPCPRDRELEQAIWGRLDRIRACMGLGPGRYDLRVTFEHASQGTVEVTRRGRGPEVTLEGCAGPVATAESQYAPDHMVVSFHFELP